MTVSSALHAAPPDLPLFGILVQSPAGIVISIDSSSMKILGIQPTVGLQADPFEGAVREDFSPVPPEELPYTLACQTGLPSPPVRLGIRRHGIKEVRWIQVASTPLASPQSGEITQVVSTITETSHPHGYGEAWPEGPGALQALIEAIPGVAYRFLVTPDGKWHFLYLSEGITDLYGVSVEEGLKDHNALTQRILEADRDSHRKSVEEALRNLSYWTHEHRISGPGGAIKWVKGHARPRQLQDGSVLWTGVLLDITHSKQFEAALLHARLKSEELHANLASLFPDSPRNEEVPAGPLTKQSFHESLSRRELEVLRLVALGKTINEIGEMLSLSSKTIATYRSRISTKLNLANNIELTRYAIKHHLVEP